jgi:hypothetical protein
MMHIVVEFFVFVFLVQDFFLLDLRSGQIGVSLEELINVLIDPALNELFNIIDIDIVFL